MDLAVANEAYTAQALTRRGVKRVVHFHCDHFEPYDIDGSGARISAGHIEHWLREISRIGQARPTVFFSSQSVLFHDLGLEHYWGSRRSTDKEILGMLAAHGVSIHLHVHHERWAGSSEENSKKMRRLLELLLEEHELATGISAKDHWFFIHGCWALNASDASICNIVDEIQVLHACGCVADFSFPAGRRHCDPRIAAPHTVALVTGPAGYRDHTLACGRELTTLGAKREQDRFLIWNTATPFASASFDLIASGHTSPAVAVMQWCSFAPIIGGTLYIKTHAHSLSKSYWPNARSTWSPLVSPAAREAFALLATTCDSAKIQLDFLTADAVIKELWS